MRRLAALALCLPLLAISAADARPLSGRFSSHYDAVRDYAPVRVKRAYKYRNRTVHAKRKPNRVWRVAREATEPVRAAGSALAVAQGWLGLTNAQLGIPRRLSCGDFMAKVARRAGLPVPRGHRLARNWLHAGPPSAGRPGDVAVLSRGRCKRGYCPGHVGVVAGRCSNGVVVVSGNPRVHRQCYPLRRVVGFRSWGA